MQTKFISFVWSIYVSLFQQQDVTVYLSSPIVTDTMSRRNTKEILTVKQNGLPYYLDRLDGGSTKRTRYNHQYERVCNAGINVTIFVLDSGIRSSHTEFHFPINSNRSSSSSSRASCGYDAVLGIESNIPCDDILGHGTHVAALIGGRTVGVAPYSTIVGVKVSTRRFDFGDGSTILKGLEYVVKQKQLYPNKPMVVNISFGTDKFATFDRMVQVLIDMGVTVVAAGNNNSIDQCNLASPISNRNVISVGVSDENDVVPYWSNYGNCIDIYAPGTNIRSAYKFNDTSYYTLEGTSQSAPLVSGTVALYLQIQPSLTPNQIQQLLIYDSMKNILIQGRNATTGLKNPILRNRLLSTKIFTSPDFNNRTNPICPYSGNKNRIALCYQQGWWT
jgi:serine protease